jgi:hypothetical protein
MSFITIDSSRLRDMALAALENIQADYAKDIQTLESSCAKVKAAYDAAVEKSKQHWWSAAPTYPDDLVELRRNKGWHLKMAQVRSEVPKRLLIATSLVNEVNVDVKDLEMVKEWSNV